MRDGSRRQSILIAALIFLGDSAGLGAAEVVATPQPVAHAYYYAPTTSLPPQPPAVDPHTLYRLQHANPYVYGLPPAHFRYGWFGAAPRYEATRQHGHYAHPVGFGNLHQWTHRKSY